MTVADLIAELQALDPATRVLARNGDGDTAEPVLNPVQLVTSWQTVGQWGGRQVAFLRIYWNAENAPPEAKPGLVIDGKQP